MSSGKLRGIFEGDIAGPPSYVHMVAQDDLMVEVFIADGGVTSIRNSPY